MLHDLVIGLLLGLSAGFAPGPLLALVISETLQHGIGSGIRVALAPLITDAPIIVLTLYALSKLSAFESLLGVISICGGLFVFYLGCKNLLIRTVNGDTRIGRTPSMVKGVAVNFLSPHPYLFWLSVGAPIVSRAMARDRVAPFFFIGSFYLCLVGAKIGLAIVVGKSTPFLSGRGYIYTMRSLGLALMVLSIFLFRDGFHLFGIG